MAVAWTAEQQQVIKVRDRNILVSAAAGSGKTAVLVERIIQRITDVENPVDIDRLLVVTFTNAAAAEMRERIGAAIEKKLAERPEDEHMQRQLTLIHNAQITTIDSFCLYVIRNHFHEIGLEPNFRIGDEGELKLLREDALQQVLLRNYEEMSDGFAAFADGYVQGRSDAGMRQMILSLYEFSRSYPWPEEWLSDCVQGYCMEGPGELDQAVWMKPLVGTIRAVLLGLAGLMEEALSLCMDGDGPQVYADVVEREMEDYRSMAAESGFAGLYNAVTGYSFARLPACRKFAGDEAKRDRVKQLRDDAKEQIKKLTRQYFFCTPEVMAAQLKKTAPLAGELVRLTKEFAETFDQEKRRKNIVDFHDLEHFALEILVDAQTKQPRKTAEEFRDTFAEIMIDEYQDSNYVQETLLTAVSKVERGEYNIFMVGDVKQSIYRFRLARPELFMEKYDTYSLDGGDCQRIDLHRNFRSREEVLAFVNDIFYRIMARDLGNVEYDAKAALYPGASFPDGAEHVFAPEVLLFDSADELIEEGADKRQLEAKLVAQKIHRMMETQPVTDKETGELRRARYSDIVILLRSLSGWADTFSSVLNDEGIPAHTLSATGYFSAVEVQTVLAMLKILDNPRQDIPLAAVLRSPIVGMTDEELAELRLTDPDEPFCECVLKRCARLCGQEDPSRAEGREEETQPCGQEDPSRAEGREEEAGLCGREDPSRADGREEEAGPCGQEDPEVSREAAAAPAEEPEGSRKLRRFYRQYLILRELVADTPVHELVEILLRETGYGSYAAAMPAGGRREANLKMLVEKAIAYERTSYKGLFHFVRYIDELQKYDVDFGEADMSSENENVVRIMSIHKSKGLEFPIVFVCGMGKQFNRQDVRSHMVLHPQYGLGLDCMDAGRRLISPTIAKRAVAKQIDMENLGEELRVLYVALTRAKEKLVLTGSCKEAGERIEMLRTAAGGMAFAGKTEECHLPYLTREGASGYLDWLLPAVISCGERYEVCVVNAAELVTEEIRRQAAKRMDYEACLEEIEAADAADVLRLDERFSFSYPYREALERKNKYSVSELKHRAMRGKLETEEEELVPAFAKEEVIPYIPPFVRRMEEEEEPVNRGALRGTAMHRMMECYDFDSTAGAAKQLEQMSERGRIPRELAELVRLPLIEAFLASDTGKRMYAAHRAGHLHREKPFVMGFTAEELARFGFGEMQEKCPPQRENAAALEDGRLWDDADQNKACAEETDPPKRQDLTLIQGIIDVFWEEEDGIVVLDYKTDRVETKKQLADRYAAQLKLYGEALERILNPDGGREKKVKERLLYSFRLGEIVPV